MIELKEGDVFVGQIEFSKNGNAQLLVDEKEIFIYKKNTLNSLHLDKVRIEIFKADKKLEGKVIEVVSRFKKEFVGKVQIGKKTTFVIPDNNKIPVDFYIKGGLVAKDNEKVIVELTKWKDTKSPQGKIIKILGEIGDNNVEMNSIMYEYNLPVDFPQDVINESELISEFITDREIKSRRDLRDVTTLTIDPVDAKDFDDAISVKILSDNKIEIGIHIADVSHYVKPGTKLDEEAFNRATSVYLVDRCVPMLPERLSNGICSLKPNEDRLSFSVILTMDMDGKILETWMGKTIIYSDQRFTYEQAQSIIESNIENKNKNEVEEILIKAGLSNVDFTKATELSNCILILNKLAQKIRKKRIRDGSIEMGGIEVKFKLADDNKKPIGIYFKEQKEANKLIEEFMLLANKSVAKKLSSENWHNVYRVHDTPNTDKLNQLVRICESFGYELQVEEKSNKLKKSINDLLKMIKGSPEENMIETLVTRCMSKATYTIKNIGHYGLGFTHYSHFTSPIRRYPDLITHRILFDYLNKRKQGDPTQIEEQAKWCSTRELVASKAQRDSIKYKQAEYLKDKIGTEFEGIVSGITDWGMYVELTESKCEGMIRYQTLEGKWSIDVDNYTIHNNQDDKIRLGDPVKVIVSSVDLEKKQIDFKLKK